MLKQRIITAIIIAPVAIGCVFFLPVPGFSLFVGFVIVVSGWEWANLAGIEGGLKFLYAAGIGLLLVLASFVEPRWILFPSLLWWSIALVLVIRYPVLEDRWSAPLVRMLTGPVILVPGFVALVQLKLSPDSNFLILLLFFLIWGADIGAYFSGRAWGKRKLAPRVSPGKSWAGLGGGMVTAMVIALGMTLWIGKPDPGSFQAAIFLTGCLVVVLVSVLGDLTISMFKRHRGIKDSSQLLPGHGGFLDRIDSLLSAGPVYSVFLLLTGWH